MNSELAIGPFKNFNSLGSTAAQKRNRTYIWTPLRLDQHHQTLSFFLIRSNSIKLFRLRALEFLINFYITRDSSNSCCLCHGITFLMTGATGQLSGITLDCDHRFAVPWAMGLCLGDNNSLLGPSTTSTLLNNYHLIYQEQDHKCSCTITSANSMQIFPP